MRIGELGRNGGLPGSWLLSLEAYEPWGEDGGFGRIRARDHRLSASEKLWILEMQTARDVDSENLRANSP